MPGPSEIGAVEWIRTTDLLITNQLLYQLSYNSETIIIAQPDAPTGGSGRPETGRHAPIGREKPFVGAAGGSPREPEQCVNRETHPCATNP